MNTARLLGNPLAFQLFSPGEQVAVFSGSGWYPAVVQSARPNALLVTGRRARSRSAVDYLAYDARNVTADPRLLEEAKREAKALKQQQRASDAQSDLLVVGGNTPEVD